LGKLKLYISFLLAFLSLLHVSSLCGLCKGKVFVLPLPLDIDELKLGIAAAVETVDRNGSQYSCRPCMGWKTEGL
jgi:hypothetical protein